MHRYIRNLRDIRYNIMYKFQRAKKGYCDQDLFSIDSWFVEIFPKMLGEFVECTVGCPCDANELKAEVNKMPGMWVLSQRDYINKIREEYGTFDVNDAMCCWILILLRMKYCFERCDEWHIYYDIFRDSHDYEGLNKALLKYKEEAFYLFEKYFFNLWW